jgi:hypothetical protein
MSLVGYKTIPNEKPVAPPRLRNGRARWAMRLFAVDNALKPMWRTPRNRQERRDIARSFRRKGHK